LARATRVGDRFIINGTTKCCKGPKIGIWVKGANTVIVNGRGMIRAYVDLGVVSDCCCVTAIPLGENSLVSSESAPMHPVFTTAFNSCGTGMTIEGSDDVV